VVIDLRTREPIASDTERLHLMRQQQHEQRTDDVQDKQRRLAALMLAYRERHPRDPKTTPPSAAWRRQR
jgi:hypothetical protein